MIAKTIRTCFPIAAAAVSDKAEEINKLNVFPVPDGDTGTNMSLTLASVTKELSALPADADMEAIAGAITHGSLMGARGNSGVITSQILRGVAEGLVSADEPITSANIAYAFRRAVKVAFQAVRKPIEGTILTVLRDVSTKADECEKKKFSPARHDSLRDVRGPHSEARRHELPRKGGRALHQSDGDAHHAPQAARLAPDGARQRDHAHDARAAQQPGPDHQRGRNRDGRGGRQGGRHRAA